MVSNCSHLLYILCWSTPMPACIAEDTACLARWLAGWLRWLLSAVVLQAEFLKELQTRIQTVCDVDLIPEEVGTEVQTEAQQAPAAQ